MKNNREVMDQDKRGRKSGREGWSQKVMMPESTRDEQLNVNNNKI
jgi:hypothetical protein